VSEPRTENTHNVWTLNM